MLPKMREGPLEFVNLFFFFFNHKAQTLFCVDDCVDKLGHRHHCEPEKMGICVVFVITP